MAYYYEYGIGQFFFDKVLAALIWTTRYLFKAIVYLPLLFGGYLLTSLILKMTDTALLWIGLILLFSCAFYLIIYFIKGMMIAFKMGRNWLWIPLLILCLLITCAYPVWVVFEPIYNQVQDISKESADIVTWILSIAFGIYIYTRYHFLTDISPRWVYPFYKMGVETGLKILKEKSA